MEDLVGGLLGRRSPDGVIDLPPLADRVEQSLRLDRPRRLADLDVVQGLADAGGQRRRRDESPVAGPDARRGEGGADPIDWLVGPEPPQRLRGRGRIGRDDRLDVEEGPVRPRDRLRRQPFEGQGHREEITHRTPRQEGGREAPAHDRVGGGAMQAEIGIGPAQRAGPLRTPFGRDIDQELDARLTDDPRATRLLRIFGPDLLDRPRRDHARHRRPPFLLLAGVLRRRCYRRRLGPPRAGRARRDGGGRGKRTGGTRSERRLQERRVGLEPFGDLPDPLAFPGLDHRHERPARTPACDLEVEPHQSRSRNLDRRIARRPAAWGGGVRPGEEIDDPIARRAGVVGMLTVSLRLDPESQQRNGHRPKGALRGGIHFCSCLDETGVVAIGELYSCFPCAGSRPPSSRCSSCCPPSRRAQHRVAHPRLRPPGAPT